MCAPQFNSMRVETQCFLHLCQELFNHVIFSEICQKLKICGSLLSRGTTTILKFLKGSARREAFQRFQVAKINQSPIHSTKVTYLLSRSKGGSRASKSEEKNGLHVDTILSLIFAVSFGFCFSLSCLLRRDL